jgi:hypothetical protein
MRHQRLGFQPDCAHHISLKTTKNVKGTKAQSSLQYSFSSSYLLYNNLTLILTASKP